MDVFPAFIPLHGARVVVVGDGEMAEAKARLFHGSPAELVRATAARADEPGLYTGARLVFLALEDDALAARAADIARTAGALVNVVDRPALSDFSTPAIVDRSPVLAAIGTGGAAPVLATLLRGDLEAGWPQGLGRVAALSGELREVVRQAIPDGVARRAWWRRLLRGPAARAAEAGDLPAARALAQAALTEQAAPGRVLILPLPPRAELLSLAALRALGAADRIVADPEEAAEVLGYARRDAPRSAVADAAAIADWVGAGETVLVIGHENGEALVERLAAFGLEIERLPVARS